MNRIAQALHEMCLTARDFVIPPQSAPARRPLRPMVPPEHDVFAAVAHPDPDTTTNATVQVWLDSAVAPVPADGCRHCDLPPEGHGVRYAALVGPHPYTEPTVDQASARSKGRGYQAGRWKPC